MNCGRILSSCTALLSLPGTDYDVPCVGGKQQFEGYAYPGVLTKHPTGTEDYSIRGKFQVPANLHIGNIGLAPKYKPDEAVNSIPPTRTGGNMDNRRVGKGATMYFPVDVRRGWGWLGGWGGSCNHLTALLQGCALIYQVSHITAGVQWSLQTYECIYALMLAV